MDLDIDFEIELWDHQNQIQYGFTAVQVFMFLLIMSNSRKISGTEIFGPVIWLSGLMVALLLAGPTLLFSILSGFALLQEWTHDRLLYIINNVIAVLGMIFAGFFIVVYSDAVTNNLRTAREDSMFLTLFITAFLIHLFSLVFAIIMKYIKSI